MMRWIITPFAAVAGYALGQIAWSAIDGAGVIGWLFVQTWQVQMAEWRAKQGG